MFGLSNTPAPISNYKQAKQRFDSIVPLRGYIEDDPRPAANRRNKALTLRPVTDSDGVKGIALKYHSTDVITFFEDERIILEVYPSMSTNKLVNDVLCYSDIATYWRDDAVRSCFTKIAGKFYSTPRYVEFRRGEVLSGHETIVTPRVNRKEANDAYREYHVKEFVTWAKTLDRLGQFSEMLEHRHTPHPSPNKITQLLEARDFPGVAKLTCARYYNGENEKVSTMVDRVRLAVIKACGAIDLQEREYLSDYGEIRAHISAVRKYDL